MFATSAQLSSCPFPLFSKININDMFSTLPKSLTMELAVACKVKDDQVEVGRRRKLGVTKQHGSWAKVDF